jgi:hypothetical protein
MRFLHKITVFYHTVFLMNLHYTASNDWIIAKNVLESMWPNCKVLSWHLSEGTEENQETPSHDSQCTTRYSDLLIQFRSITAISAMWHPCSGSIHITHYRDGSDGIATGLWAGSLRNRGSIPSRGKRFFSSA